MDNQLEQQDPMMEIFMEECSDLVTQYETYLSMAAERKEYTMDIINEIFRITHTIKADATMMLFECIAIPMRSFERILYFYRDEKSNVDFDVFTDMLNRLVIFVKEEVDKILEGKAAETDGDALKNEFQDYRDKLAGTIDVEKVENIEKTAKAESHDEPMRFYIGSAADESAEPAEKPKKHYTPKPIPVSAPDFAETEKAKPEIREEAETGKTADAAPAPAEDLQTGAEQSTDASPAYDANAWTYDEEKPTGEYKWLKERGSITSDELQNLYDMIRGLNSLEGQIMARFGQEYSNFSDLMAEFHGLNIAMLDWVTNAATMPMGHISPKLRRTVDEMNQRLGRDIKLTIKGEDVLVEKSWMDKLSGALVHMIRNAVDHGIESKERRQSIGKNPQGKVVITYAQNEGMFTMTVSDDGRGIDIERLKATAIERGLIFEDDEIAPEDIMKLIFLPGVTTNDREGVYSGRGVGMDVVNHNIEQLGGSIKIESKLDEGTSFITTIPMNAISAGEEFADDEDFDSRR